MLPLVCRQYYEASRRWEIAGLGIFELYTPATPLSTQVCSWERRRWQSWVGVVVFSRARRLERLQAHAPLPNLHCVLLPLQGITRRCRSLGAWLDNHASQLVDLNFNLPPRCRPVAAKYGIDAVRTAVQAAIMPAVEKAAWRHRAAFASLLLGGSNLAAALAAAEGQAPAESGLAACVALHSLELHNYEGGSTQLAQLLGALPHLPALRLHYGLVRDRYRRRTVITLQQLVQGPPAELLCAALQQLHVSFIVEHLMSNCKVEVPAELVPALPAFTALTYLQLPVPRGVDSLPDGISQLRFV